MYLCLLVNVLWGDEGQVSALQSVKASLKSITAREAPTYDKLRFLGIAKMRGEGGGQNQWPYGLWQFLSELNHHCDQISIFWGQIIDSICTVLSKGKDRQKGGQNSSFPTKHFFLKKNLEIEKIIFLGMNGSGDVHLGKETRFPHILHPWMHV